MQETFVSNRTLNSNCVSMWPNGQIPRDVGLFARQNCRLTDCMHAHTYVYTCYRAWRQFRCLAEHWKFAIENVPPDPVQVGERLRLRTLQLSRILRVCCMQLVTIAECSSQYCSAVYVEKVPLSTVINACVDKSSLNGRTHSGRTNRWCKTTFDKPYRGH